MRIANPIIPPPPKDHEDPLDPKFDQIRTFSWFRRYTGPARLAAREKKLKAYKTIRRGRSVNSAARDHGISIPSMQRFWRAKRGIPCKALEPRYNFYQSILDEAYAFYRAMRGEKPMMPILMSMSARLGVSPDMIKIAWRADRFFVPTCLRTMPHVYQLPNKGTGGNQETAIRCQGDCSGRNRAGDGIGPDIHPAPPGQILSQ